ncbi:MAG: DUF2911 domain-containing protein [Acidobacteriia bacterium]|nr:DUF2911 domain-containing protein [Terriglobia bacterium]
MRRLWIGLSILTLAVWLPAAALAQGGSRGTSKITVKSAAVSVEYGRPALKGRSVTEMLAKLKPGQVWRLGSNQSTTFTTAIDLKFGDVTIPKGEYSLWARREADNSWKLVFNKQHGQWGTQHDAAQDLAAVPLKESKAGKPAEMVTINLQQQGDGGAIAIQWGDMELTTDFAAS